MEKNTIKSKSNLFLVLYSYPSEFMQMILAFNLVSLVQLAQISLPTEHKLSDSLRSFLEYLIHVKIQKKKKTKNWNQSATSLMLREEE